MTYVWMGFQVHFIRDRDNLRTKDKRPVSKMSFVRRFDCSYEKQKKDKKKTKKNLSSKIWLLSVYYPLSFITFAVFRDWERGIIYLSCVRYASATCGLKFRSRAKFSDKDWLAIPIRQWFTGGLLFWNQLQRVYTIIFRPEPRLARVCWLIDTSMMSGWLFPESALFWCALFDTLGLR